MATTVQLAKWCGYGMRRMRLTACAALVSALVWDGEHPPRFIERKQATRPGDSGWDLFCGAETEAFMADPANFRIVKVHQIVDRFPAFKDVIEAPQGSRFRLHDGAYLPTEQ
jgi:hypothetical protein